MLFRSVVFLHLSVINDFLVVKRRIFRQPEPDACSYRALCRDVFRVLFLALQPDYDLGGNQYISFFHDIALRNQRGAALRCDFEYHAILSGNNIAGSCFIYDFRFFDGFGKADGSVCAFQTDTCSGDIGEVFEQGFCDCMQIQTLFP